MTRRNKLLASVLVVGVLVEYRWTLAGSVPV